MFVNVDESNGFRSGAERDRRRRHAPRAQHAPHRKAGHHARDPIRRVLGRLEALRTPDAALLRGSAAAHAAARDPRVCCRAAPRDPAVHPPSPPSRAPRTHVVRIIGSTSSRRRRACASRSARLASASTPCPPPRRRRRTPRMRAPSGRRRSTATRPPSSARSRCVAPSARWARADGAGGRSRHLRPRLGLRRRARLAPPRRRRPQSHARRVAPQRG